MRRPVWQRFESILADPINRYLAAKRSIGCRFNTEDRALRLLDRYLADQGVQERRLSDVRAPDDRQRDLVPLLQFVRRHFRRRRL